MSGLFGLKRPTRGPACPVCNSPGRKLAHRLFHVGKLECECGRQEGCSACNGTGWKDCWRCRGMGFVEAGSPGAPF